ncbi:RNA polymerase sigma factor [Pedobacter westerhofensis]|nr:RNA polymerase sigma-70 factor [Pedobacter westerhofensis]
MQLLRGQEQDLLLALKGGSRSAFLQLYNLHVKKIYAYSLSIIKSPNLAQDITQDVFIKLWETAAQLKPELSLQAYLFTITRNLSLNVLRSAAKEHWITDEIAAYALDSAEDGMAYTERRQTAALMNDAIAQLPPQRRKIYELCHQEGYSYKQAAEKLGITDGTINSQMVKALRFIKGYLLRNGALFFLFFIKY